MTYPSADVKEKSRLTKEEWREYTRTVWRLANTSSPDHPAVFPEEIPTRLIKLFSYWGEAVLDPFAGTGTTAVAALKCGRRAICIDQNARYIAGIKKRIALLEIPDAESIIVRGDARKLTTIQDNSIHLIITSPPYWNKADYGTGRANIGNASGYAQFLSQIGPAFDECFRVLAPGRKFCVVTANVNQHTNHGLLTFPLATDFAVALRDIGFVMVNEIVWVKDGTGGKWGSHGSQRPIFGSYPYPPNFLFKNVHEYVLIFAKPPAKPQKGPKARQYDDLMRLPSASKPGTNGKKAR